MASPYGKAAVGALVLAAALLLGPALAEAGSRSYTPRSAYVPRSSGTALPSGTISPFRAPEGVIPGAFGRRSDPTVLRMRDNRRQIERFREQSRARAEQREIMRQARGPVTDRRPAPPGNRLTDRLRPRTAPLLPNRPDPNRLDPNRLDMAPFAQVERNTR